MRRMAIGWVVLGLAILVMPASALAEKKLRLATTTSTYATGLLDKLGPMFKAEHGYRLDVIAVGTGKALKLGARGDVDVVWVHAPRRELKWIKAGNGINRRSTMHNYFVIVGPKSDPAKVAGAKTAALAFKRIKSSGAKFVSRGDDSGTNIKELIVWAKAGLKPVWPGYKAAGLSMGRVLLMASEMGAYTLSDIATWRAYRRKLKLKLLLTGDPALANYYSVIAVNPYKHPHVKYAGAMAFIAFVTSPKIQKFIGAFKKGGKPLFWPDAAKRRP